MVWKFCEIWKFYGKRSPEGPEFCEILSHSVRYGMYALLVLNNWALIFAEYPLGNKQNINKSITQITVPVGCEPYHINCLIILYVNVSLPQRKHIFFSVVKYSYLFLFLHENM